MTDVIVDLWSANSPQNFWRCVPELADEIWIQSTLRALPILGYNEADHDISSIMAFTLGEGKFGPDRWKISTIKKSYYFLKPVLPEILRRAIHRLYSARVKEGFPLSWPIEPRYANFMLETLKNVLLLGGMAEIKFQPIWPMNFKSAFTLTHDIESKKGLEQALAMADFEESLGFRSSFNFVPEKYKLDWTLIDYLRQRGFEIGLHGLRHDGRLFYSRKGFDQRVPKINQWLDKFGAVGFRSPMTHRNPEWMQDLKIDYDLSFFDSDPFEPMPGGVMSIWPFYTGHFIELPYTLVQDCTLTRVLGTESPEIWLNKFDYLNNHFGLALVNAHPDHWSSPSSQRLYTTFLREIKQRSGYWHALPKDVSNWWRSRTSNQPVLNNSSNLWSYQIDSDGKSWITRGNQYDEINFATDTDHYPVDHLHNLLPVNA